MMKLRRKYKAEGVIMIKAHKCIRPPLCIKRIFLKIYEKGCKQGLENFDDSAVIRLLDKKLVN